MSPSNTVDAIVVGSGFGGAVAAARLAESGLRVLVLERGPWWGDDQSGRPFPRGPLGMRRAVRNVRWSRGRRSRSLVLDRAGLLEVHLFERLLTVGASGIGGGSLVYADIQAEADERFWDHFPQEITAEEMRRYYDRVRAVLQPAPLPGTPARTAQFELAAAAAGFARTARPELAVDWAQRDSRAGAGSGHASTYLLGCEHPGKRTLARTYIPAAITLGAEVRALSEVDAIERDGGQYIVHWIDHATRRRHRIRSPRVILAAGTLGTLRLLFNARDRDHTLELPPSLGRRFSPGGDMAAFAYRCAGVDGAPYGPCGGAALHHESASAKPFVIAENGLPLASLPLPGALRRRLQSSVVVGAMARDASDERITFDGRELRTRTSRAIDPALYAEVEHALSAIVNGLHATRTFVNLPGGPGSDWLFSVHPMGGASIADTPEHGVVNHAGALFGSPGLFVADAAGFPTAAGFPPSMTIAALAERQAELIVNECTQTAADEAAPLARVGRSHGSPGPLAASS